MIQVEALVDGFFFPSPPPPLFPLSPSICPSRWRAVEVLEDAIIVVGMTEKFLGLPPSSFFSSSSPPLSQPPRSAPTTGWIQSFPFFFLFPSSSSEKNENDARRQRCCRQIIEPFFPFFSPPPPSSSPFPPFADNVEILERSLWFFKTSSEPPKGCRRTYGRSVFFFFPSFFSPSRKPSKKHPAQNSLGQVLGRCFR